MRRRIHACHMRRRIHAWSNADCSFQPLLQEVLLGVHGSPSFKLGK
jgi:hypothetical protein